MPPPPANLLPLLQASDPAWHTAEVHTERDSTQAALRLHFATTPATDQRWRLLAARHQTAGRGRGTGVWLAAPNSSVLMSVGGPLLLAPELWPRLSLVAGLAVREVLARHSGLPLQLKWPNDIVVQADGRWHKLAGLLCERVGGPCADPLWLCGLGVNVTAAPTDLSPAMPAIALQTLTAAPCAVHALIVELALAVRGAVQACQASRGLLEIATLERHLAFVGTVVEVDLGPRDGTQPFLLQGLDSGGELRGRWLTADGSPASFASISPLHIAAAPAAGWLGRSRTP